MEHTTVHKFCQYCGSERDNQHWSIPCQECGKTPESYHITVKQWLKYLLLQIIPIYNIILLIQWGFTDKETHPTLRTYSRVSLIWGIFWVSFVAILITIMVLSGFAVESSRGY